MRPICFPALAAGLLCLLPGALRADTTPPGSTPAPAAYQIQPIVKQGDTVAGITISDDADFEIGALNDQGQLAFVTESAAGGEALFQYAGGRFTLIAAGGEPAPTGTWPGELEFNGPVSMNEIGTVAFNPLDPEAGSFQAQLLGIFRWDAVEQKTSPMVLKGMRAVNGQTITAPGPAIINDRGDIAFQEVRGWRSTFFLSRDGQLAPVALGRQAMPGGGTVGYALPYSLNDAGVVVFRALRQPDGRPLGLYRWENGTITSVLKFGAAAPDGGVFINAVPPAAQVNDVNRNVLVAAAVADQQGDGMSDIHLPPTGLYRFGPDGEAHPVVAPGQAMPGGGTFQSFGVTQPVYPGGFASDGQTAFQAELDDGSRALYVADAAGRLSLVLKEGATTELGKVTGLPGDIDESTFWLGLNRKGQIAVPVQIDNGPTTVVLLAPATPPASGNEGGAQP